MTGSEDGSSPRVRALDVVVPLVVGLVVPVAVTLAGGGFGIPRNDDWSHARSILSWAGGGRLTFESWSPTTLVGQLLVTYPVARVVDGRSALQAVTLAEGLIALACLTGLARTVLTRRAARLAGVAVAITPLWIPLVASYMTDVPALMGTALAAWCVARAVGRTDAAGFGRWAIAALAAATWAVTVRQNLVAVLGVVIAALAVALVTARSGTVVGERQARRERRIVATGSVVAVVAVGVFLWWRTSLPPGSLWVESQADASLGHTVRHLDRLALSLGLLLLPVVALLRPATVARRVGGSHPWFAAVTGIVIAASLARLIIIGGTDEALLGDHATRFGSYPLAARGELIPLLPSWIWILVLAGASVSLWLLGLLLRDLPVRVMVQRQPTRAVLILGIPVGLLGVILVSWPFGHHPFDRYLLLIVPFLAIAACWGTALRAAEALEPDDAATAGGSGLLGWVVVGAYCAVTVFLGLATTQADRGRWDAGEAVVARTGLPPAAVDAGFDWVGVYVPRPPDLRANQVADGDPCVVVVQSRTSEGPGTVVGHDRLLGVDRWFHAVDPAHAHHRT